MILPKAAAKAVELFGKVPESTRQSVLDALIAIVNGEPSKAERLSRNAALAVAAEAAAETRIKAKKKL